MTMFKKTRFSKGMGFPTFIMEDVLVIFIFMGMFCGLVFFYPQLFVFGDAEIPADPFNTPGAHQAGMVFPGVLSIP